MANKSLWLKVMAGFPAQILAPLSQLLSVISWTYFADKETIGVVTLITASQELFNAVFLMWWTHYFSRHYYEYEGGGNLPGLLKTSRSVVSIVVCFQIVAAIFNLYYFVEFSPSIYFVLALAIFVSSRCINQYLSVVAATKVRVLDNSVHTLAGPFFGLLIGLYLLSVNGPDPLWPIFGYACGELMGVVYYLVANRNDKLIGFSFDSEILKKAIRYGGPMPVLGFLAWVSLNFSRYLVNWELGLAQAGVYAVGFGLGIRAGSMAAMAVAVVTLPIAFKRDHFDGQDAGISQLCENSVLLVAILFPALAGFYLISDEIVVKILAAEFHSVTLEVLPWSLLAGCFTAYISHFFNHVFFIQKRTKELPVIELLFVFVIVVSSYVFIENFGLVGAVIGLAIGKLLQLVFMYFYLLKTARLSLPWREYGVVIVSVVFMGFVVRLFPSNVGWALFSAKIAVGSVVYFSVLFALFKYGNAGHQR